MTRIFNYLLIIIGTYLLTAFAITVYEGWTTKGKEQDVSSEQVIEYALKFLDDEHLKDLGKKLDCSGFTFIVFKKFGFKISRSSRQQFNDYLKVNDVPKPGDLVFFAETNNIVSHVGIALSDSIFIHSPGKDKPVRTDNLSDTYWKERVIGAKTVLTGK